MCVIFKIYARKVSIHICVRLGKRDWSSVTGPEARNFSCENQSTMNDEPNREQTSVYYQPDNKSLEKKRRNAGSEARDSSIMLLRRAGCFSTCIKRRKDKIQFVSLLMTTQTAHQAWSSLADKVSAKVERHGSFGRGRTTRQTQTGG